uniref:50S ribosomal protein L18 n=2 Tax=Heterorhabditis bacteriophora TaxID=37862 RepID=A0A1I7WH01_HETBA
MSSHIDQLRRCIPARKSAGLKRTASPNIAKSSKQSLCGIVRAMPRCGKIAVVTRKPLVMNITKLQHVCIFGRVAQENNGV